MSISNRDLPLPRSTARALKHRADPNTPPSPGEKRIRFDAHPGLLLTKLMPWEFNDKVPEEQADEALRELDFAHKSSDDAMATLGPVKNAVSSQPRKELVESWEKRRSGWLTPLAQKGRALHWTQENITDLVLWLAAATPAELGFCLHHTYGLPYLPGSAQKGVARAFAHHLLAQRYQLSELELKDDLSSFSAPKFDEIFGCQKKGNDQSHGPEEDAAADRAGCVDFLDAIPCRPNYSKLSFDVMTPHHSTYYGDPQHRWPHDCESPTPISFLKIPRSCTFQLALTWRPSVLSDHAPHLLRMARALLVNGLALLGLGAKTTSGYGVMVLRDLDPAPTPQTQTQAQTQTQTKAQTKTKTKTQNPHPQQRR